MVYEILPILNWDFDYISYKRDESVISKNCLKLYVKYKNATVKSFKVDRLLEKWRTIVMNLLLYY